MAKLANETLAVVISRAVKEGAETTPVATEKLRAEIEEIVTQLIGGAVVVEVTVVK